MTQSKDAPHPRGATHRDPALRQIRRPSLPRAALVAAGLAALGVSGLSVPAGASSSPTVVKAVETDFHIALSKSTFSPGRYTFVAQNKGGVTHSLEITGPGLSGAKAKNIAPGQSTKLTVTFKKGAYDIFCPIPGHKAMGMNVDIVVGGAATAGSNTSRGGGGTSTTSHSGSSGGYGY
jgi:plastocyanin